MNTVQGSPSIQGKPPGNFVIRDITDATFERDVLKSQKPVFVFFFSKQCSACHDMEATLNQIGIAFSSRINFVRLNIHNNPAYTSRYVKAGMPCSVLFNKGDIVRDTRITDGQSVWTGNAANLQYFLNWLNTVLNVIGENW